MFRILAAHYGTKIYEEIAAAGWHSIMNAGLQDKYKKSERRAVRNGSKAKGGVG